MRQKIQSDSAGTHRLSGLRITLRSVSTVARRVKGQRLAGLAAWGPHRKERTSSSRIEIDLQTIDVVSGLVEEIFDIDKSFIRRTLKQHSRTARTSLITRFRHQGAVHGTSIVKHCWWASPRQNHMNCSPAVLNAATVLVERCGKNGLRGG